MKAYFQNGKDRSSYSALLSVLTLLMAGIFVKIGAAIQLIHLAQN
jgi:hypothetical protein